MGIEPAPFPRATSVQKCLRTLDIDEVGKTARHATFFQMAGNFCFGDYFKEGAITAAWELLTTSAGRRRLRLRRRPALADRLPGRRRGLRHLAPSRSACPTERIQRRGMADNFWSMGVPGPCGPCSEIFFDRGPTTAAEGGPVVDEERYLEVWNLVFMQYERGPGAGQGGLPDPRRAAEEEHRHRHGRRADGLPAAGRGEPLRDRRGLPGPGPGRPS